MPQKPLFSRRSRFSTLNGARSGACDDRLTSRCHSEPRRVTKSRRLHAKPKRGQVEHRPWPRNPLGTVAEWNSWNSFPKGWMLGSLVLYIQLAQRITGAWGVAVTGLVLDIQQLKCPMTQRLRGSRSIPKQLWVAGWLAGLLLRNPKKPLS